MEKAVDIQAPVSEIITALHKYGIPIALIPAVFDRVMKSVKAQTVPYNPSCLRSKDFAISDTTDSVTDPNG
jgi:hypothetical protein